MERCDRGHGGVLEQVLRTGQWGAGPGADRSVADFGAAIAGRLVQNVAVLASQGTIRHDIAGMTARSLDADALAGRDGRWRPRIYLGSPDGLSSSPDGLPS